MNTLELSLVPGKKRNDDFMEFKPELEETQNLLIFVVCKKGIMVSLNVYLVELYVYN